MGFLQQTIVNIHVANNIKAVSTTPGSPEFPALIFDKTKQLYGQYPPTNTAEYLTLYGKIAPVYNAVSVKARTIAQLPIQILKKTGNNEFEDVTDTRTEYKIFKQPNEFQTKFDFWEQAIGYLNLAGESPWLFQRKLSKITQMYPLRPDLVKTVPHSRTIVSHYLYRATSSDEIRIDPEFMLFLKFFNPLDYLRGLSPIAAAEDEVILDINAVTANKNTFSEGAQPSGLISTKEKIGDTEGKRIRKDIEDKYTGSKNYGKIMFLTHGFEWHQMQMSNRDMQYMEQRLWSEKTIAQVYGVPPILQMQFKDSSVLQNTEIQYKLFWDRLKAEIVKIEEVLTERLLPEITDEKDVSFKFDLSKVTALQPDMEKMTARYTAGFGMGGITPNEIRADIFGKDPSDNPAMDLHYVSFNLQPIEDAGMDFDESETTEDKAIKFCEKMKKKNREIIVENNGGGSMGEIHTIINETKQINEAVDDAVWVQKTINDLNKINQKSIKKFQGILAKLFKDQEKEVLNSLFRNKFNKFSTVGVGFNIAKWVKRFKDAGRPEIARALELAAINLANDFNDVYNVVDPNAIKYVNTRSIDYAKQINKTTTEKIDNILKAATQNNLSIDETAAKLTLFFGSSASMRALRIARTEMVRATNEGRQFAAMQMKKIGFKQWATQRDGLVRDLHVIMDGDTVAKGKAFSNGSFVPDDINERCYVIYRKAKG